MTAQIENEIKYVLKDPKGLIENLEIMMENKECIYKISKIKIKQGYLDSRARLRHSIIDNKDDYKFTYKYILCDKLYELETKVNDIYFESLWIKTTDRLLKTRYSFQDMEAHWDIDFFFNEKKAMYFSMAEAEIPDGMSDPERIPNFLSNHIVFKAPRLDENFTSKKISNIEYGKKLYEETLEKSNENSTKMSL
jgi:hypothetical protein